MEKRKSGSKHSISYVTRSLKKLGRSVGRSNPAAIARQVLTHGKVKTEVLKAVGKLVRKEMMYLCKRKTLSLLRGSPKSLETFSWEQLSDELCQNAPVFCQVIKMCVVRKRRKTSKKGRSNKIDDNNVTGIIAALLLRHRNQRMNLFQRIVSLVLYSGHAPKKVFLFFIFYNPSGFTTIVAIDGLK